jgi:hypothetical protein
MVPSLIEAIFIRAHAMFQRSVASPAIVFQIVVLLLQMQFRKSTGIYRNLSTDVKKT